jgi:hypothetical protein
MAFKMKGAPFAKGKKTIIAGQHIKNDNGEYSDVNTGVNIADPKGKLKIDDQGFVEDNDYVIRNGKVVRVKGKN